MTPRANHKRHEAEGQAQIEELLQERLRLAIKYTLIQVLEEEVAAFVNAAPYQRTPQRKDYRNGSYERDLGTSIGVIEDLPVPRTRNGFQTELFEHYHRRQAELDEAICQMFVRGVSTAQAGDVVEALSGASRVFHSLEGEFESWKQRKLKAHYLYLFADGAYFSVIYDAEGCKMPILAVVGIDAEGRREVLAFPVGERENQKAWEDLLDELKSRGVETVDLWITDGNKAMLNAIALKFPTAKRQRCVKHKMENVLGYIPEKQQEEVRSELRAIFYQENREKADQELAAFRNENSCLLFFYAVIRSLKLRRISVPAKDAQVWKAISLSLA